LRDGVPKYGLKLPFRQHSVCELAIETLKISALGLKNRRRLNRRPTFGPFPQRDRAFAGGRGALEGSGPAQRNHQD